MTTNGTTRYLCPLDCGWHYDRPDPDLSDPDAFHPFIAQPGTTGLDALAAGLAAGDAAVVDQALKEHLGTHDLVEWVTALVEAQRKLQPVVEEYGHLRSATGQTCPDILIAGTRVLVIGERLQGGDLLGLLPPGAGVGPGETVVEIPAAVLRDAARDLMGQPDLLLAISESEGDDQRQEQR